MVAIPLGVRAPELTPLDSSPRDWSYKWDGSEPPAVGEPCYCIALVQVRKKANWQPRTADSQVPTIYSRGSLFDWWSRRPELIHMGQIAFSQVRLVASETSIRLYNDASQAMQAKQLLPLLKLNG